MSRIGEKSFFHWRWMFFLLGGFLAAVFWLLEAAFQTVFLGHGPFIRQVVQPGPEVLQIRILVAFLFFFFGGLSQAAVNRLRGRMGAFVDELERLRGLFDRSPVGIHITDEQGRIDQVNRAWEELFRTTEFKVKRRNFSDFLKPASRSHFEKDILRLRGSGAKIDGEYEFRREDGSEGVLFASSSELPLASGATVTQTVLTDVTDRKRDEDRLRLEAFLLNHVSDLLLAHDPQGRIRYVNDGLCKILDLSRRELLQRNAFDLFEPAYSEEFKKCLASGKRSLFLPLKTRLRIPGKDPVPVEVNLALVEWEEVVLAVAVARDLRPALRADRALLEAERRFQSIFQSAPDAVIITDENGKVLQWNRAAQKLFGYTPEEMLGRSIIQIVPRRFREKHQQAMKRFLSSGKSTLSGGFLETEARRKDGTDVPVEISISHWRSEEHVFMGAIVRDISERRRISAALEESEMKFRTIAEKSLVGIYLIQDDLFRYCNPRGAEILGYTPEEITDKLGPKDVVYPPDWPVVEAKIRERISGRSREAHYRARLVRRDGQIVHVEIYGTATVYRGKPAILGSFLDITESDRLRRELEQSERFHRTIVQNMKEGLCVVDLKENIRFVNRAFCEITGYSEEELLGENLKKMVSPEDYKAILQQTEKRRRGEGSVYEVRLRRKDGEERIALISAAPILDERGNFSEVIGIVRDVTQQRALEAQLQRTQKLEALGQLTGGVAHDFNNILTAILGNAQLAAMELPPDSSVHEEIQEIMIAGRRAEELVSQLLAFSRKQVIEPVVLNLNDVIRGMQKMLTRLIGEDIEIQYFLAEDLQPVKADHTQIEQVILNIIINARDAINERTDRPAEKKITVETLNVELAEDYVRNHVETRVGRYVLLAISDTGVGMDRETLQRIFDPFFTTKEMGRGTGLGLATVYGIVRQNGGNIFAYSEPGKGSTLKVYWPVTTEPAEKSSSLAAGPESGLEGSETIVVIEDDEGTRNIAVNGLRSHGYNVAAFADSARALEALKKGEVKPDLVLTDVVMPKMSGKELADELAKILPAVPVVFMSGYTDNHILHSGILEKGVEFIQKPFSIHKLAQKVRQILDRP